MATVQKVIAMLLCQRQLIDCEMFTVLSIWKEICKCLSFYCFTVVFYVMTDGAPTQEDCKLALQMVSRVNI